MPNLRYYITTPIYYVNDTPHIGHAYTSLSCDLVARWHRLAGEEVRLLTGTDEHGQKVRKAAVALGEDPQAFTDRISDNFRALVETMQCSPNDFIRTTEPRHRQAVQAFWIRLRERNQIYEGVYSGWYAVRDEAFYEEDETEVGEDGLRRACASGAEVEWLEEPSYFFRLSEWQERLVQFYEDNPSFILPPTRRNEVLSFVKGGLRDLSVSRKGLDWGIPVPDDSEHVVYVWLDALVNYLAATGWPDPAQQETYEKWWPADLHMVGKDILRFHAVYWPAFLLAAELPVTHQVFGHGWLLNRGRKMSKSEGNVLRPADLVERYGLDPLRYYLIREVPFGQDGYISHDSLVTRCNAELSNGLGNLAQRSLTMVAKNLGGTAPVAKSASQVCESLLVRTADLMKQQALHRMAEEVWSEIGAANRFFDEQAPWTLAKQGKHEELAAVLAETLERLRLFAYVLYPIMPTSCRKLLVLLGDPAAAVAEGEGRFVFSSLATPLPSRELPVPSPLFARLDDEDGADKAEAEE